jgi:hypothetical protein
MKLSSQLFKLSGSFIDGFTGGLNYSRWRFVFSGFTVDQETKYKGLQLCDLTYQRWRPIRSLCRCYFSYRNSAWPIRLRCIDVLGKGNSSRFNKRNWLRTRFPREQVSCNDKPAVN